MKASELMEPTMLFDVVSTLLKSQRQEVIEIALNQALMLKDSFVLAYEEERLYAVKMADMLFGLFASVNPINLASIKVLEAFKQLYGEVSVPLLPYGFLPEFSLPLPTIVTELNEVLPSEPRAQEYVKYEKLLRKSKHPLAKYVSYSKLWIFSCITPEDETSEEFVVPCTILQTLEEEYELFTQINQNTRTLQEEVRKYNYSASVSPGKKIPENLINLLQNIYKSDELKLFDSFSGYMYGNVFPEEGKTFEQVLGSGFFSNLFISDDPVEADLLREVVLGLLYRIESSATPIALLTKRLALEFLVGELYASKVDMEQLPNLLRNINLSSFSGFNVINLLSELEKKYSVYQDLVSRLEVFPNEYDIYVEGLDLRQQMTICNETIAKIESAIGKTFQELGRDVYLESGKKDLEEKKFYSVLDSLKQ